jgi:O-antigen/teichoic acid export membrane protein
MKRRALESRLFFGTLSNVVGQGVIVLAGLLVVPLIVHRVGATDYGIWAVTVSVASLVQIADLGVSDGLVKYVAQYVSSDDRREAALFVGAATWNYAVIGTFIALAGLALAAGLPEVLGLQGHIRHVVAPMVALVAVALGIYIPSVAPLAVLRGLEQFPVLNVIRAGGALLEVVLTIPVLLIGGGIVGLASVFLASTVATFAASVVVVRRTAPDLWEHPIRRDPARARRLLRFSLPVAFVEIAGRLQLHSDAIVIAVALPVRFVTPYNFAQRLADGTRITTEQFVKVLLPVATEVSSTRQRSALGSIFLTVTRLSFAIAVAVALPLILLGGPTLSLWVGPEFRGHGDIVAILAASAVFDLCLFTAAAILQSIERHQPLARMALAGASVNVLLSITLVGPFGIVGVALSTLIASSGVTILFALPYAARTLGVPLRTLARDVLVRLLIPIAVFAAVLIGGDRVLPVTSIFRLGAVVGVGLACYGLVYMVVGAGPLERVAYRSGARHAARWLLRPLRGATTRA